MKKIVILVFLAFSSHFIMSQNVSPVDPGSLGYYIEALADSRVTQTGGSARTMGMAGTQTALGADMGAGASNPAGLGVYRRSEIIGSLALNFNNSSSTFLGKSITDIQPAFGINNLGIAFCSLKDDLTESDWRGGTFAISMNTLQNNNVSYSYQGTNKQNSFINSLIGQANKIEQQTHNSFNTFNNEYDNNNFSTLASLGYNTYLINADSSNRNYFGYIPYDKIMDQKGTLSVSGATRTWSFGYGANYKERLFIGASLGITSVRRTSSQTYTETLQNGGSGYLSNFTFTDKRQVKGTGINLTIGAIYKIDDMIRLGASFKTPDWYSMHEDYDASISANYNNIVLSSSNGSPFYLNNAAESLTHTRFDYRLYSPMKANIGASVFLGKIGFVSLEGEYINYKGMFLSKTGSNYFNADNNTITNLYKNVVNVRSGIELRADKLRFRGGYAFLPGPYANDTDERVKRIVSDATNIFSLGFGIKFEAASVDLAYSRTSFATNYSPYTLENGTQPLLKSTVNLNAVVLSVSGNF